MNVTTYQILPPTFISIYVKETDIILLANYFRFGREGTGRSYFKRYSIYSCDYFVPFRYDETQGNQVILNISRSGSPLIIQLFMPNSNRITAVCKDIISIVVLGLKGYD